MLDMEARYSVATMPGIAFYLLGPVVKLVWPDPVLICESKDCDHYTPDGECYAHPEEPDEVVDESRYRAVMVGDDRVHEVDVEDLTLISPDDYCGGCGQIGCGH